MANPYQQKARQRKVVYWILIGALLTGSLMHRKWVVEQQANDLQLRETTRGEVELTGSAVRLMLTGSKGLAVPILWSTAIEMQKKHQWSEFNLVVGSITKLQPYFITPWLFQSWNMAFNVAVEFDRPQDKYYYISKGLELMAEGERRNQGSGDELHASTGGKRGFPGNPELRHHMGFTYQLKIGNSDEKNTMRCLLDMSCIHPSERNADDFWTHDERGRRQVKAAKFDEFCAKYPRLVRRLRDSLRMTSRQQIVTFLEQNRDLPSRFKKGSPEGNKLALEEPRRQFPIFPPHRKETWPDATEPDLALDRIADDGLGESFDVFLVCKTWYDYSMMPMPEANPNPGTGEVDYDRLHYRMPKAMAQQIFRSYPARAQVFIAENLQAEGWFDSDGWNIPEWADNAVGDKDARLEVAGAKMKNDSGRAWRRGYDLYLDYGTKSGLYIAPETVAVLDRKAQLVRNRFNVKKGERLTIRSDENKGALGESYFAHMKLTWNEHYKTMCNYDNHLYQAEGEADRLTVAARKLFHQAEQTRRFERAYDVALPLYEEAWPLWIETCLRHPRFTEINTVREDAYELSYYYTRIGQQAQAHILQPVLMGMAQLTVWPHPAWEEWRWLDPTQKMQITRMRNARGPIDGIQAYNGPQAAALREFLLQWTLGAEAYKGTVFVPPVVYPDQQLYLLTRWASAGQAAPLHWIPFVGEDTKNYVAVRLGLK
jgi:hypothetical protein